MIICYIEDNTMPLYISYLRRKNRINKVYTSLCLYQYNKIWFKINFFLTYEPEALWMAEIWKKNY